MDKTKQVRNTFDGGSLARVAMVLSVCALPTGLTGCSSLGISPPASLGEDGSGYTYVPIDPTKVEIVQSQCELSYADIGDDPKKESPKRKLLDMLPDNAVRMSMEITDTKGKVTYGVSKAGVSGSAYKLTADYVNSDTVNKNVWIRKTMLVRETSIGAEKGLWAMRMDEQIRRKPVLFGENSIYQSSVNGAKNDEQKSIPGSEQYDVISTPATPTRESLIADGYQEFNVPIYVGIGLRIVAEGVSLSGDANISGIGIIGAEAEAKRLLGSLTVQTLGVNSQAVASALPVQSELSRTTAENAFVSIGSIKSMLHQSDTIKMPRVVGLYLPFPGGKPLVNALISDLSRSPVPWCPNGYAKNDTPAAKSIGMR